MYGLDKLSGKYTARLAYAMMLIGIGLILIFAFVACFYILEQNIGPQHPY